MYRCEDCKYYNNENTYDDTGFCILEDDYVKADDNCEEFSEE